MHSPSNVIVALTLACVFAALAAVHVYWAVGSTPAGGAAVPTRADGQPLFCPSRATTMAVALLLLAAAGVMLGKVGILAPVGPMLFYRVGPWVIGGVLLLRTIGDFRYVGLFKRVRGSRFARFDSRYYTPLCAVLAAGAFYVAAA